MSASLHTIHLWGALRKQFGPEFRLQVSSVTEAAHALSRMVDGFGATVAKSAFRIILGDRDTGRLLHEEEVRGVLPVGVDIHIVPAVQGAGGHGMGIGKIIIGAILVVASFYAGGTAGWAYFGGEGAAAAGGAAAGALSTASMIGSATLAIGMSLALSGAAMLLSPQAKAASTSASNQNSFAFSGIQNNNTQGVPVPVVYGLFEVGSVVVSTGITTQQLMN